MTKIVYSPCFGGFGLSQAAQIEYERRTGREWGYDQESKYDRATRADPVLVAIVEEMGKAASGRYANLQIVDLPAGTEFFIEEYDGFESIRTRGDIKWEIA